jgi:hypothetical protein
LDRMPVLKGTVWVPFKMLRERIPMLSAMTLDQLGAKMRCDKCGKRPDARVRSNLLMPWSRRFDEPIQPPKGKKLVTLKDAAAYILALPKSKQQSPEWQAAGEAVIMAAEDRGPLMHAHVGMMLALHGAKPIPEYDSSKERHWGRRKLKRDE